MPRPPPPPPPPPAASLSAPRGAILVICFVNFSEAVQGNILWPFLPLAVARWGAPPGEEAFYVGLVASSFFLAQALTGWAWAWAADRVGRRPVLLWSVLATGGALLAFGFSESIAMACAARFLGGALSGSIATSKVYVGESAAPAQLTRAFSNLALTWGLGTIVAPTLGGLLASPAQLYPANFGGSALLARFPYLLPSLVGALWAALTAVLAYYLLPETPVFLARRRQQQAAERAAAEARAAAAAAAGAAATAGSDGVAPSLSAAKAPARHARRDVGKQTPTAVDDDDGGGGGGDSEDDDEAAPMLQLPGDDGVEARTAVEMVHLRGSGGGGGGGGGRGVAIIGGAGAAADALAAPVADTPGRLPLAARRAPPAVASSSSSSSSPPPPPQFSPSAAPPLRAVLCSRGVLACISSYGLLVFVQVVFDELLPVIEELSPSLGGLGYSAVQSGSMQIVAGVAHVMTQAALFPWASARFGARAVFRASLAPLTALAAFPLVHLAPAEHAVAALGAALVVKTMAMALSFSTIILITNNVSRGQHVALITGTSQTVASAVRALGPTAGGALFAASLRFAAQLGAHNLMLTYAVLSFVVLLCAGASAAIPSFADAPPDYGPALCEDAAMEQRAAAGGGAEEGAGEETAEAAGVRVERV